MTKTGHIEIRDSKVIFVYYELPKPDCGFNQITGVDLLHKRDILKWNKAMREYEASKQSVKVENINWSIGHQLPKRDMYFRIYIIDQKTPEHKYFDTIVNNGAF